MFCPKCGDLLHESNLLQRNVRIVGNVPVEYDAQCPNCRTHIGKMQWGKLTVNPELPTSTAEETSKRDKASLIPPPPELRTILRPHKPTHTPVGPPERLCPHCGLPIPPEL